MMLAWAKGKSGCCHMPRIVLIQKLVGSGGHGVLNRRSIMFVRLLSERSSSFNGYNSNFELLMRRMFDENWNEKNGRHESADNVLACTKGVDQFLNRYRILINPTTSRKEQGTRL